MLQQISVVAGNAGPLASIQALKELLVSPNSAAVMVMATFPGCPDPPDGSASPASSQDWPGRSRSPGQ